ncbi:MAG: metal ABC transporter ATP-binding protein [Deltaproteobacteria bacterium]|nr:metal ABC transporter ATP-binding protein [Deltaproteobacteria bacterium]
MPHETHTDRVHHVYGRLHGHRHAGGREWSEQGRPIVELTGVSSGYRQTLGIAGVNLKLWPAQFLAVVGPNGGGKTTLLRTILGHIQPREGRITVHGSPAGGSSLGPVGYVPQLEQIDLNFPITVEEVVLLGLSRHHQWFRRTAPEDRDRAHEIMDRLNLLELGDRQIRELSGGQQQAAFIARALLGEPELILLDEPTSGLDIRSRDEVVHFLHEINHSGVAILITSHDLNWVAAHLPWVVCLNRHVIAEGEPQEIFTTEVLGETYKGEMVVFQHGDMIMVGERPHSPNGG